MVSGFTPSTQTVMVAVRVESPILAAAVAVTVSLPEPEVVENVSQDEASLLIVQFVFEVIVKDFDSPE